MIRTLALLSAYFILLLTMGNSEIKAEPIFDSIENASGAIFVNDAANDMIFIQRTAELSLQLTESTSGRIAVADDFRLFSATAIARAQFGQLGVYGRVSAEGGWAYSPGATARAGATWTDEIALRWKGDGAAPSIASDLLRFNYKLDGALESQVGFGDEISEENFIHNVSFASLRLTLQGRNFVFGIDGTDSSDASLIVPFIGGGVDVPLDSNLSARTSMFIGVEVFSTKGTARANFNHTLYLDSITFLDGTTPESHGWEILFESGIQSPNIAQLTESTAVPEPSTFALFGISGLALATYSRRRKRGQAA
jgi:hypothetical protein